MTTLKIVDNLNSGNLVIKNFKYKCSVHGEVKEVINSTIPNLENSYCMKCWLETLNKVEIINDDNHNV